MTLPYGGGSTLGLDMDITEHRRLMIGEVARQTGLTIKTVRYYESRELVELAARCNEGEIVPRLEQVLRAKLEETETKPTFYCLLRIPHSTRTKELQMVGKPDTMIGMVL